MTTKFNLTINPLTVVLLIGFVICLVIIFRSCQCDPGEEIGRLQGEVEARDEQLEIKEAGLKELEQRHEEKIAELNGEVDSAYTVIETLRAEDHNKSETIVRLESEFDKLSDKDPQIKNLKAQVEEWKGRFSLAQDKLSEKDKIIFSLQEKYEAELELRKVTQVVLEEYKTGLGIRDELVAELERKLRSTSRWQTLERLAFLAVSGVLLYSTLT